MYIFELCITSCLLSKWMKNPYGSFCAVSGESVSHLARRSASGPLRTPSRVASKELVRSLSSRVSPECARVCSLSVARRSWDARSVCWRWCDSLASEPCNFTDAWDESKFKFNFPRVFYLRAPRVNNWAPYAAKKIFPTRMKITTRGRPLEFEYFNLISLISFSLPWIALSLSFRIRAVYIYSKFHKKIKKYFLHKITVASFTSILKFWHERLEIIANEKELFTLHL